MTDPTLNDKLNAIKKLLDLFKFERTIYLLVTIISLIVLLICAVYLMISSSNQIPAVIGMFGSSGGIGFTCGRLLKMWSDAIKMLSNVDKKDTE